MNPPFPHKKTDTPVESFVDRALEGLSDHGKLAVILPMSLMVKKDKGAWRDRILARNTLLAVCQLPDELFQPYASVTTSFVVIKKGVPHSPVRKTTFVRLQHDGLTLRKGTRVQRATEPNQIPDAIDAMLNRNSRPGFSRAVSIGGKDEWAPGAYIESSPPDETEIKEAVDVHLRRLASFYARYAREIVAQRHAIENGELALRPYRDMISTARLRNAEAMRSSDGTIGAMFDVYYGMKELHSREGYASGATLVISPTEEYNGCYGWLEFPELIEPPFVTVAQMGTIGEAFVQLEPCAVNDDCLILLAKPGARVSLADLVVAAATLHAEKWRFTYGRKLTPSRIVDFRLPQSASLRDWITVKLAGLQKVISASLNLYEDEYQDECDVEIARTRLREIKGDSSVLIEGDELKAQLDELLI